jgi:antitoxin component YwqK of YwqJK toxin-antitoxin module
MKEGELKLQEILEKFRSQKHLKDKLLDRKLEDLWNHLYSNLSKYTSKVQFRNGKLSVWIESSALKQELNYNKEKIIKQLNEKLDLQLIINIEFR